MRQSTWPDIMSLPNTCIIKSFQTSMGVMACTRFWCQGRKVYNKESEMFLLDAACPLVLFFIPTKCYQNISKGIKVMEPTSMHLRNGGTDNMLVAISPPHPTPTYRSGNKIGDQTCQDKFLSLWNNIKQFKVSYQNYLEDLLQWA